MGDWLVDQHWIMGIHRSRTSSRVGQTHYRTLQDLNSTVTSFCGAGRTAAILHRAQIGGNDNLFGIVGLGVWHPRDITALEALLDPAALKGHTPHQLLLSYKRGPKLRQLINLVHSNSQAIRNGSEVGTTSIIRLYKQTGSKIELLQRMDWEVTQPSSSWVTAKDLRSNSQLNQALKQRIDAIVVKDLCKGCINRDVIGYLARKLPRVPWFVSSKRFLPDWLTKDVDRRMVYLLEIPQAAVQDAIDNTVIDAWMTRSGSISKDALELLNSLGRRFPEAAIVAIPSDDIVLAHGYDFVSAKPASHKVGVTWSAPQANPSSVGLPMASVCFAALTAHLLHEPNIKLDELVELSVAFTQEWRSFEAERLTKPITWDPRREPPLKVATKPPAIRFRSFRWSTALEKWRAAYRDQGIIRDGGTPYIDLSRAMTEVRNYICISSSKRRVLRQVVHEIQLFKRERGSRSCMIIAAPGSGKSLLAQLFAEDQALHFLEFNITQLMSKSDILDCFDLILTTQFENRGRRLLVFVDEIDAHLSNESVYDVFLAPLEQGVYRRAGKTFPIAPCFWLFAGTKNPSLSGGRKASDFVSRLTLKPLSLRAAGGDDFRLEYVYLGAAILRTEFPDVREISAAVLNIFRSIRKDISIRELRQFVRDFADIRSGQVIFDNAPKDWFKRLGIAKLGRGVGQEEMVEVRGEALSPDVLARFTPGSLKTNRRP